MPTSLLDLFLRKHMMEMELPAWHLYSLYSTTEWDPLVMVLLTGTFTSTSFLNMFTVSLVWGQTVVGRLTRMLFLSVLVLLLPLFTVNVLLTETLCVDSISPTSTVNDIPQLICVALLKLKLSVMEPSYSLTFSGWRSSVHDLHGLNHLWMESI